jgi:hypothetical protein
VSLGAAARRRYARQLLLGEIGEVGQERLLDAAFTSGAGADPGAFAVAADYLRRAGAAEAARGREVRVPDEAAVMRFAGALSLREPAAAVIGAFCAVEHLKATLGMAADAQPFPGDVQLRSEG